MFFFLINLSLDFPINKLPVSLSSNLTYTIPGLPVSSFTLRIKSEISTMEVKNVWVVARHGQKIIEKELTLALKSF